MITAQKAKSLVQNAFDKGILKKDTTVEELMSIIPDDDGVGVAGGVLAWSGWALVYPNMTEESSED